MKKICLCFQIHQPYRLRRYRFFDIGNEHYYPDDFQNEEIFQRIAEECYLPANRMMLDLLRTYPDFCVSYSISGLAIEQMEYYKPEVIESFKELVATGRVELLAESYAHSMTAVYDPTEWKAQIIMQRKKLQELFGISPSEVLCNTELLYNDSVGELASELGFKAVITEGAKHILGWKSPNYVYNANTHKPLKLLMRNAGMSDLVTQHFTRYDSPEYPVTADKIINGIKWQDEGERFALLYMNYEVLGAMYRRETGIFDFFKALPMLAEGQNIGFATPSQLAKEYEGVDRIAVNNPITLSGEEKSVNEWFGNVLQQGVVDKLSQWGERVRAIQDRSLLQDWLYLQSADHLYYMNTSKAGQGFSPYNSAYDAFNNYMNVLSDFLLRVEELAPNAISTEALNSYEQTIITQDKRIEELEAELAQLRRAEAKAKPKADPKPKTTPKTSTAKANANSKTTKTKTKQ